MRKLKLDPEMLAVESFTTREDKASPHGTVEAHSFISRVDEPCSDPTRFCEGTQFDWYSCGTSCQFHCLPTFYEPSCADC